MIKNYIEYIKESGKIDKFCYQKANYGNRFIPIDIYHDLQENGISNLKDIYEEIIQDLMIGKYDIFSILKNPDDIGFGVGLANGYVDSVKLVKGIGNFSVKMRGFFGKKYTLNVFEEVRVSETKPKSISTEFDPYGEEDWGD